MRHATGGYERESAARTIRLCDHDVCTRERERGAPRVVEGTKKWHASPRSKIPRRASGADCGADWSGAAGVLLRVRTRARGAATGRARGCPTPVRPRWRPRLGSSRCARVLRLPRRDERARSPGSPSTQNPASSVVAVGGSDAGIPDRVAPFPGSRLTPRSPPPPTTAAQAILRGWRPLHGRLPRARGGAPRRSTRGGGGRWRERHRR